MLEAAPLPVHLRGGPRGHRRERKVRLRLGRRARPNRDGRADHRGGVAALDRDARPGGDPLRQGADPAPRLGPDRRRPPRAPRCRNAPDQRRRAPAAGAAAARGDRGDHAQGAARPAARAPHRRRGDVGPQRPRPTAQVAPRPARQAPTRDRDARGGARRAPAPPRSEEGSPRQGLRPAHGPRPRRPRPRRPRLLAPATLLPRTLLCLEELPCFCSVLLLKSSRRNRRTRRSRADSTAPPTPPPGPPPSRLGRRLRGESCTSGRTCIRRAS